MWVRNLLFRVAAPWGLALLSLSAVGAEALRLQAVDVATLAGDQVRLDLTLSGPAPQPAVFHTDNPARIALDFPGVTNGLGSKTIPIDTGVARSVNAVEARGRTRVVVNLLAVARYDVATEGDHVFVTLYGTVTAPPPVKGSSRAPAALLSTAGLPGQSVRNVDFSRGEKGEGRVLVSLSDPNAVADMRREGGKIVVYIPGATVSSDLEKKLDVTDFATPVKSVETVGEPGRVKISVTPSGEDYDYSSYQTDNALTLEFRHLTRAEREAKQKKDAAYGGEKLTLNFQDIPVRQVLQILADFTGMNMVASDTVQGNVTLRLNDVPWDQALDIVLKSKGLAKRQEGNVVRIGPMAEVQKQEQQELEANREVEKLEPLKTELIAIKYAKADDIKTVLMSASQKSVSSASTTDHITQATGSESETSSETAQSVLSDRGTVTVDPRTNTLLVKDTAGNIDRIRQLVAQLDVAVRQVMIEARVVIATDNFTRNLGVKFTQVAGGPGSATLGGGVTTTASPSNGSSHAVMGSLLDLAAADPRAKIGFTILRSAGSLLDLELSAGQNEGTSETLSSPRLLTSDGTKAMIKQGTQIPVQSGGSATTAPSVTYKDAVLLLEVTPHIAPDDNVMLDLKVTKDSVGNSVTTSSTGTGIVTTVPAIEKKEIQTNVQVKDGDTVVLGGVYEDDKQSKVDKIPFLSDIPYLGPLLQRNNKQNAKRELLVFVTPKIVRQNLVQNP